MQFGLCVCLPLHVHVHWIPEVILHVCMCACVHVSTYACVHVFMCACVHACMQTRMDAQGYTSTRLHVQPCAHVCTCARVHVCTDRGLGALDEEGVVDHALHEPALLLPHHPLKLCAAQLQGRGRLRE